MSETYSSRCRWLKTYTVKFRHHFRQELSLCKSRGKFFSTAQSELVVIPMCTFPSSVVGEADSKLRPHLLLARVVFLCLPGNCCEIKPLCFVVADFYFSLVGYECMWWYKSWAPPMRKSVPHFHISLWYWKIDKVAVVGTKVGLWDGRCVLSGKKQDAIVLRAWYWGRKLMLGSEGFLP